MTDAMFNDTQPRSLGMFANRDIAETAKSKLLQEGFDPASLQIVEQRPSSSLPTRETQAAKSAKGGAIAFGLLGATVGLLLSLTAREYFDIAIAAPPFPPILAIAAGAFIGGLAGGLMGVATGVQIPQEEAIARHDYVMGEYRLDLNGGSEEDLRRARLLLQKEMNQGEP
ncbi:MAG: hypothetical protein VKK04_21645 [Synechococcales bacterium]|nr:hypothetical protein [Synechococcales bacterium]